MRAKAVWIIVINDTPFNQKREREMRLAQATPGVVRGTEKKEKEPIEAFLIKATFIISSYIH